MRLVGPSAPGTAPPVRPADRDGGDRLVLLAGTRRPFANHQVDAFDLDGTCSGDAAAPSLGDLTGNGTLEIVLTTVDHGVDVYTVPGSGTGCLLWPTGRGSLLRNRTSPLGVG